MKESNKSLVGMGILTAVAASLCCITPVLALLSGATGIASTFSWMEPARPYFIATTVGVLGFAWYLKLKPRPKNEMQCACDEKEKTPFMQTKTFLGIVTVLAAFLLAFPYYAHLFYPSSNPSTSQTVQNQNLKTVTFKIKGMTCNGCAAHISNDVSKLEGVFSVDASYEQGNAIVKFDPTKVNTTKIEQTINETGYQVVSKN